MASVFSSVYLLTQVQVDGPDWPAGLLVLVVLQNIRFTAQPTASQHEPAPLPRLERVKHTDHDPKERIIFFT